MWDPSDNGEWWKQRGSYLEPVVPPTTDIGDAPLFCIHVNQEWLPYLAGAAMQLAQPSTWDVATEADRQLAIARATDLIAEIGTAVPCGSAGTVSITIPAGSATAAAAVTFSPAFSAIPVITLGIDNPDLIASIASAAATGFDATITAAVPVTVDTTADVTWMAALAGTA